MKLARLIITLFYLQLSIVVFSQSINTTTTTPAFIRSYNKAIGVKLYPGAISYKQFFRTNKAVEGVGFISKDGFQLTILNEKYTSFENTENLSWYVGYGGHMALWNEEWKKSNSMHKSGIAVGVDGILGLDYKIKGTPLNVSVDWQPSFNFVGGSYFESGWGGIGARYTF